jgi:hypothetical protein
MGSGHRFLISLLTLFLLNALFASGAASQSDQLRIKVLTADFRPVTDANPIPRDCDMQNYSAYCNESRNPTGDNIMRVQDGAGNSFTIKCTVDSRWSKCSALSVGETYEARRGKRDLIVWMQNPNGKEVTRSFKLVDDTPATQSSSSAGNQPVGGLGSHQNESPGPQSVAVQPGQRTQVPAPPPTSAPPPAPVPNPGPAIAPSSAQSPVPPPPPTPVVKPAAPPPHPQPLLSDKVRCDFVSTPSGAEITLDGKYVGSTPSTIGISPGTHAVVLSAPGFAQWQRELTVTIGSDLTVNATLQKESN